MEIIITKCKNKDSWYRNKIGQKFTVFEGKFLKNKIEHQIYNVINPEDDSDEQSFVWRSDCEVIEYSIEQKHTTDPDETCFCESCLRADRGGI